MKKQLQDLAEFMKANNVSNYSIGAKPKRLRGAAKFMMAVLSKYLNENEDEFNRLSAMSEKQYLAFKIKFVLEMAENQPE